MQYDATVVGAGPAGSLAALHLTRAGARVLLLEKERLGRDKPCGGGLTPRSYVGLEVPIDDLVEARVDGVELRVGARPLARVRAPESSIWMVQRRLFDRRLAEAASAAGADLHELEAATAALPHERGVVVETPRGRYEAPTLLLAAGAEGRLRSTLGFPPHRRSVIAVELEGPSVAERLDGRLAVLEYGIQRGYAWAFPKGDIWNLGIGTVHPQAAHEIRRLLATFVDQLGVRYHDRHLTPERAVGRRIPLWDGQTPLARGRVAALGDAAGLADPFFAEGIAQALESGRLAARAALDVLAGRATTLDGYTAAVHRAMGRHLRRMQQIKALVEPAPALWIRGLGRLPVLRRKAARVIAEPFDGVAEGWPPYASGPASLRSTTS